MSIRPPWLLPLLALLSGCTPKIGNKCTLSTDCSQLGDRLCDTNQPEGYCTVFNCEPDNCPDSICVAFDPTLDPACKTADDGKWPRFERTFCMRPCDSDGDCRDQYQCVDLSPSVDNDAGTMVENPALAARRAQVVDTGAADGGLGFKVCMVKSSCADGVQDHDETDVDCGGPACQKCAVKQRCLTNTDCASGACSGGVCQAGDSGVPAVCLPPDAGLVDGGAPWPAYDGGP
jgi:hypothetical protein